MPPVDVNLVLDIDGDADEIIIPQDPPQYTSLTCPDQVQEGQPINFTLSWNNEMANTSQHTAGFTVTGDDSLVLSANQISLSDFVGFTTNSTTSSDMSVGQFPTVGGGLGLQQTIDYFVRLDDNIEGTECLTLTLNPLDSLGIETGELSCTTCIVDTTTPIYGCTDSTACNYNAAATVDDGSCSYSGCTDESAPNYNPCATVDDGSCLMQENRLIKISVELVSEDHNMELHTNKGLSPVMGVDNSGNPSGSGACDGSSGEISTYELGSLVMVQFARSTLPYGDLDSPVCPEATSEEECGDQASFYMSIFSQIGPGPFDVFENYPTINSGWLDDGFGGPTQGLFFLIKPKAGYVLSRHNLRIEQSSEALTNEALNKYWSKCGIDNMPIYQGISPFEYNGVSNPRAEGYDAAAAAAGGGDAGECLTGDCMFRDENSDELTCGEPLEAWNGESYTLGNKSTMQYAVNYDLYANGSYVETKSSVINPSFYQNPFLDENGFQIWPNSVSKFHSPFGSVTFTDRFSEGGVTGGGACGNTFWTFGGELVSGILAQGIIPGMYSVTYPVGTEYSYGQGDFDWHDNGNPCVDNQLSMLQANFEPWWNAPSSISMKRCLDPALYNIIATSPDGSQTVEYTNDNPSAGIWSNLTTTYNQNGQLITQLDANGFYFNNYETSSWEGNFVFLNPMRALNGFNYMEYPDVDEIRFKILGKAMPIAGEQMPDPTDFNIDIIDS